MMKTFHLLAAVGELVAGLALLILPSLGGWLLLGEELSGVAVSLARVLGIALVGLAVACWPGPATPRNGMSTYSATVTTQSRQRRPRRWVDWHTPLASGLTSRHPDALTGRSCYHAEGRKTEANPIIPSQY
jgi:hypothetical protein